MKVTPTLTIFVVLFLFLHCQMHVDLCLWLINQNAWHYNAFVKANANAVYDTPLACLSTSAGLQHSCPKHVPSLTLKRFTTHQSFCFLDWTSHDISSFALWHTQVPQPCQHRARIPARCFIKPTPCGGVKYLRFLPFPHPSSFCCWVCKEDTSWITSSEKHK